MGCINSRASTYDEAMPSEAGAVEWERFLAHYSTLRGLARHELVARQLRLHLPRPPAGVVDVGGGAGHQAIPLARDGYDVTVVDPSEQMLDRAREALRSQPAVRARVRLVAATGEEAPTVLGSSIFDAVLCHGVLMHLRDPRPTITALAALARPGGIVSVLAKNRDALAMRAALEGRWRDALSALDATHDVGALGVPSRGDTVDALSSLLDAAGIDLATWYGVRIFTDHLGDREPGPDAPDAIALEWEAGRRDPYRSVARLVHLVGVRRTD